jgi:hypothetical protein
MSLQHEDQSPRMCYEFMYALYVHNGVYFVTVLV